MFCVCGIDHVVPPPPPPLPPGQTHSNSEMQMPRNEKKKKRQQRSFVDRPARFREVESVYMGVYKAKEHMFLFPRDVNIIPNDLAGQFHVSRL